MLDIQEEVVEDIPVFINATIDEDIEENSYQEEVIAETFTKRNKNKK